MKSYDKIYVPCSFQEAVDNHRSRTIGLQYHIPLEKVVVLTEEELLDLLQESIEYSHSILPRDQAKRFLIAKLIVK